MRPSTQKSVHLEFENIGCLSHIGVEFRPGLNIIRAPNASGKTSLVRALTSMFSDRIPPGHILALDNVQGRIRVQYDGAVYEKVLRRTTNGSVLSSGSMLPFADHRAFDACVALADTGVVHKITGGGAAFREYLENLSYGKYYSVVISSAQELVDELSRELAGPNFKNFEALPLFLTELTELHIQRDQIKERIKNLQARHKAEVDKMVKKADDKASILSREETRLSVLKNNLAREEEKEQQLLSFLGLTDDSSKVAVRLRDGIAESKAKQSRIGEEVTKRTESLEVLEKEVERLKSEAEQKRTGKIRGLRSLEKRLRRINKSVILKEEDIQQAEKFAAEDPKYTGRLVIEVRGEILKKIDWLNKAIAYFQEKYLRRMTTARLRFNRNITKAFEELGLKGFETVFLDQDFSLHLVRENSVQQPVETLSASEKLTISLILMLAAKETFLPNFPLFIVDELTLSYDPERFKQIVNYVKQRVPYVIVTSLTGGEVEKPEVTYET